MATVQPFTRSMIEKYLKDSELHYLTDTEGDFIVQFAYDKELGGELAVYFIAGGNNHDIYLVRVTSSRPVSKPDWGRAISLCNTWNKDRRWPKAYLRVKDPSSDDVGSIILEEQIDLSVGVHQELVEHFSLTVLAAATQFWKWAHGEFGL